MRMAWCAGGWLRAEAERVEGATKSRIGNQRGVAFAAQVHHVVVTISIENSNERDGATCLNMWSCGEMPWCADGWFRAEIDRIKGVTNN